MRNLEFWHSRKYIQKVVLFCLIIVITACDKQNNVKTLKSTDYNLEFQYPENWTIEYSGQQLLALNPDRNGLVIRANSPELLGGELDSSLESYLSSATFNGVVREMGSVNPIDFNGYNAVTAHMILAPPEDENGRLKDLQVILAENEGKRVLISVYKFKYYERELVEEIDEVLKSFKFYPPAAVRSS